MNENNSLSEGDVTVINGVEFEVVKLKDIYPGDEIISPQEGGGLEVQTTTVVKTHPIETPSKMYRITDDKGNSGDYSGDHLFYTETDFDLEGHATRVYRDSKVLRKITKKHPDFKTKLVREMSLHEIANIFTKDVSGEEKQLILSVITRIAMSIGPVSYEEPPVQGMPKVSLYDCKDFIKQVDNIINRKYSDVIIGKVVTAEEIRFLIDSGIDVRIPSPSTLTRSDETK